ncbi:MAG: serine/threonine-protein phosphatase [Bacteroidales bacterium]|nr:serine/threonine-protein phosphatase [Bacteroidales bacterium]
MEVKQDRFFIEVDCQQKNHGIERICGDVFLSGKIKEEGRIVLVLSDGMGHGVKASVLATLTATMALNFTREHREPEKTAEIIMKTLPECSERKMNYSTFTIIEVDYDGKTHILEYDNPECILIRDKQVVELERNILDIQGECNKGKKLRTTVFQAKKGDRLIFTTDGVAQSGLGTPQFPFGWGNDNVARFAIDMVKRKSQISARELADRIINHAHRNDGFQAKDDTSCGIIFFREPRELLITTGPPYEKRNDRLMAERVRDFKGMKIVMGATTGDILSRELKLEVKDGQDFMDPELPPINFLEGVDLYTEGILTLSKVENILRKFTNKSVLGRGPADEVIKLILQSDEIQFLIGTRINLAHQDPESGMDVEIRRTVVRRIALLLEEKFLKKVKITYV